MKPSSNLGGNIRLSDLRHSITLHRITATTTNDLGHPTYTTSTTVVPARIRMLQNTDNSETEVVAKQTVVQTPEFLIRHTTLTVQDWIVWDGNKYDIVSIDITRYHKRFLIIKAKAVI